nr:oligosaccharide flippase family protein [Nitrincola sp. A-D6]
MSANRKNLSQNVKSATIWLVLASFSSQFLRLLSNLILTRLLVPEYFGVMSIVILIWTGLNLLTDAGLQQSVVKSSAENLNKILPTIFSIQLVRGFGIFLVVLLMAYLSTQIYSMSFVAGTIYSLPELSMALLIISIAPLLAGFQSPGIYLLQRKFQQKKYFL